MQTLFTPLQNTERFFFFLADGMVLNIAALSRVRQQYLCVAQPHTSLAPPLNVGKHIGEDFLAGLGPDWENNKSNKVETFISIALSLSLSISPTPYYNGGFGASILKVSLEAQVKLRLLPLQRHLDSQKDEMKSSNVKGWW